MVAVLCERVRVCVRWLFSDWRLLLPVDRRVLLSRRTVLGWMNDCDGVSACMVESDCCVLCVGASRGVLDCYREWLLYSVLLVHWHRAKLQLRSVQLFLFTRCVSRVRKTIPVIRLYNRPLLVCQCAAATIFCLLRHRTDTGSRFNMADGWFVMTVVAKLLTFC